MRRHKLGNIIYMSFRVVFLIGFLLFALINGAEWDWQTVGCMMLWIVVGVYYVAKQLA